MGYPEEHTEIAEHVEYKAPCGVLFASGVLDPDAPDVVNIGAGGGPHHMDLLSLIDRMGERDAEIHVINITPEGGEGRPENTGGDGLRAPGTRRRSRSTTLPLRRSPTGWSIGPAKTAVSSSSELPGPAASDAASSGALPTT